MQAQHGSQLFEALRCSAVLLSLLEDYKLGSRTLVFLTAFLNNLLTTDETARTVLF